MVSLAQAKKVLARYDICFMAPERMRTFLEGRGARAEYWPDACFANRHGYSKLLLTPDFYERFTGYEYLLLYQLDAFVFSDRLADFCAMGYDYIGAPMPYWSGWPYGLNRVGNGGLALRKIAACIRVTRAREKVYERSQAQDMMEKAEDKFFAYCGWDKEIPFTTPPAKVAEQFAVEFDFDDCYRKIAKGWLPFGCHGWSKRMHFDRWEPHIRAAGYDLDEAASRAARKGGREARREIYMYGVILTLLEYAQHSKDVALREKLVTSFSWLDGAILWGNGVMGKRAQRLFAFLGFHITCIFDKAGGKATASGIPVKKPDAAILGTRQHKVLVTPKKYYDEIEEELCGFGLLENEDFYRYRDIERSIARVIAEARYGGKRFAWL